MKRTSYLLSLLIGSILLMSSCESSEGAQLDLAPLPPPPQASSLREIARVQTKTMTHWPILTQDGAYYVGPEGINKISISGDQKLFLGWDRIPEFWKSWQENLSNDQESSKLPHIFKMTDESFVVGEVQKTRDYYPETYILNLQHISKDGVPLKHIQSILSSYVDISTQFVGLDATHALVISRYEGNIAIIDLSKGTLQPLVKAGSDLSDLSDILVVGKQIFSIATSELRSAKSTPEIVVYNFDGKVVEKKSFASLLGITFWNEKADGYSSFSVSDGKVGLWVYQSLDSEGHYLGTCTLYLISPEQLSKSSVSLISRTKEDDRFECEGPARTWLGGRNFAIERLDGIEFGKLAEHEFFTTDTWMWDWRFELRKISRTQDGSLTVLEIAKSEDHQPRLLLINPDGRLRLTHTFTFDAKISYPFTIGYELFENYVLVFGDGNQILYYKIENTPAEKSSH